MQRISLLICVCICSLDQWHVLFSITRHGDSSHNVIVFFIKHCFKKKVIDVPKFKIKREHINLLVFFGFFCAYIVSRR